MQHVYLMEENCGVFGSLPKQKRALNHGFQQWIRCQNDLSTFSPQFQQGFSGLKMFTLVTGLPGSTLTSRVILSAPLVKKQLTRFIAKPEEILAKLLEG